MPHTIAEKITTIVMLPLWTISSACCSCINGFRKKEKCNRCCSQTSHDVAKCFKIEKEISRPGYNADLVLINRNKEHTVNKNNLLYKCGWSPFEGHSFSSTIDSTIINGEVVFKDGIINESFRGERLKFDR